MNRLPFEIQQTKQLDFFSTAFLLLESTFGLLNLFGLCYYGSVTSTSFQMMGESLYECDWYNLSIEWKKNFLIMFRNVQRPIAYHGQYFAVLNLNIFFKVWTQMNRCFLINFNHLLNIFTISFPFALRFRLLKSHSSITWCLKQWHQVINRESYQINKNAKKSY